MKAVFLSARVAFAWCLLLVLAGCTDPYIPEAISNSKHYLVVDGFINTNGITTIKLSRTINISAVTPPPAETRATIFLEEEAGQRYTLREGVNGTYTSASLSLNPAKKYRLHITTTAGKMYASDFVVAKATPAIDNITWDATDSELHVKVNTHDATNNTQHYRWDYEETWEIAPLLSPDLEWLVDTMITIRTRYPSRCWRSDQSTSINLSKTTDLSQNVVSNYIIRRLPKTTELLHTKYSILVKQYALSREEYQYWDLLRKNTESIGTLFDPLPSQLTGNIHCLNDDAELALGFVGAYSVEEKRIFISRGQLPTSWRPVTGYENCVPTDSLNLALMPVDVKLSDIFGSGFTIPLEAVYFRPGVLWGYTTSTPDCVDCRKRGTAVQPSFWQ